MAPIPQVHPMPEHGPAELDAEAVVISGVSTIMPGSRDIMEYADKLYNKVNMVKCGKPRWDFKYPELSKHYGTIPQLGHFDAQFFMVFHKMANTMDPMTRKLLEQSYQAIFDAGICPTELHGRPIGVFVATDFCETEQAVSFTEMYYGIIGVNRAMSANRISYYLNLKGPSMYLDADSAGTAVALQKAYTSIISGQCEAAIVGGAKLMLHPQTSLNGHKLIKPCPDGHVKSYEMHADGTAYSETVSVIFLQKYKDAKRVYASVRHIKTAYSGRQGDNMCQQFGAYRDHEVLTKFLRDFYVEAKVAPSSVDYVEGYGAADPKADKAELDAICEIFCKDRQTPLNVGSVTSNVGHTNSAWCLTALTKMVLAYQRGIIAGNINCENPRTDVNGLLEGRLKILTENSMFQRKLAAINNFSITGINAHVLLEGHYKPKNLSKCQSDLPYLLLASGRQESSIQRILDDIRGRPLDVEEIALLNNIHRIRIPKHLARGYAIYSSNENKEAVALKEKLDYFDDVKRPLWFVYSGMGSQWAGMGAHLMRIPIFADAINRCHKILEPKGIDLINIITNPDKSLFDNILHSFVGIAAVQIGLTDVLKAVGLVPDKIIGHSVGELGCAYADGCLTAEEMILSAYSRGLVSLETPFIKGSMAAVGIGYKQIIKLLPPEIEVACHNGPESSTISGPADIMKQFVAQLTEQGVFAKEVPCSNIAYHSRYIAEAGPGLLNYLQQVIPTPRLRSSNWLSSSIPQKKWSDPLARYSGAEYHTNNLLNPVLFEEVLTHVPYNAVLIEIAPHGLLQAILKRSLPDDCRHVSLTRRGHDDNVLYLLEAIGKLYMEGFDIDISALYPKVEFPVSTETRPLSHLVEWMYSEKYFICHYVYVTDKKMNSVYKPIISIYDEEHEFLNGNIIDGRKVFPHSGILVLVWDLLAMSIGKQKEYVSVQFKDIAFHFQPPLLTDRSLRLTISLQRGTGRFEVTYENNLIVAEGYVNVISVFSDLPNELKADIPDRLFLNSDGVYGLLFERGYNYKNYFRSIKRSNISFTDAQLNWKDNWITFIDGVFQMNILRREHQGISQPQYIKRLCIDVLDHINYRIDSEQTTGLIDAVYSESLDVTRCGGLVIEHMTFKDKPVTVHQIPGLKELKLVPFNQQDSDMRLNLYVFLQIVAENLNKNDINITYIGEVKRPSILDSVYDLVKTPPEIRLFFTFIGRNELFDTKKQIIKPDLVILSEAFSDKKIFEGLYRILEPNIFIINLEPENDNLYPITLYHKICIAGKEKNRLELAKWRPPKPIPTTAAISVRNDADLEHLKATKDELFGQHKLLILAPYPGPYGLKKLVQEWRSESNSDNIFVVMINRNFEDMNNTNFPSFDLVFNVLDNGIWGGEYYLPIKEDIISRNRVALKISQFGDLDSMEWIESTNVSSNGIPVKVHFAGLNVYDAKRATAEIAIKESNNRGFGMDFSGVTENGDRVMGLIKSDAVSSKVVVQPELLWPVPEHWSLEDACTIPLPYCLAFYCIALKTRLIKGMNVLIHGGSGAVGQAAISICLKNQCNVYTTVSTIKKKQFLQRLFPDLPAENIGNSRDETFEDMVVSGTRGEGCHIIISCVQGMLKQKTLRCCATSGLTLDTVLIHSQEKFEYGMYNMTKSRSYTIVDFSSIFTMNDKEELKALQQMVSEGILHGYVRPLSRVIYSPLEVSRAFRLLAASRHYGRVLVNLEEAVPLARPKISCSSNGCYLVLCDKNEFGTLLVDKLVDSGVKKIYVHYENISRFEYKRRSWQNRGANIKESFEKLINKDDVTKLLKRCHQWAQIEGIFVTRPVSKDTDSLTRDRHLLNNLHVASKEMELKLKYFTVIDENGIGNEICLSRAHDKLKSLSVQLQNLIKFNSDAISNELQWSTAINCIIKALHSNASMILAYREPISQPDIIGELCKIPGVKIQEDTPDDTTLEQIGIDEANVKNVCITLENNFNLTIMMERLQEMTLAELQRKIKDSKNMKQELTGLSSFVNNINDDELNANCDMVLMRTLFTTSELRSDDFDNEQTFLCVVPGIEGLTHRFKKLCERVKLPALVLQPGFDHINETVEEMAQRLATIMKSKLILQNHFYLVGYEFGILIALEMARILEKEGLTGTIYCLGGTPENICTYFKEKIVTDCGKLQNDLLEHLYELVTGKKLDEVNKDAIRKKCWEDKIDVFIKVVRDESVLSFEYIRAIVNVIYRRLTEARDYIYVSREMRSKIIILNTKSLIQSTSSLTHLSDLQHYTAVHDLNISLPNAAECMQCASIINKYLEPEILDEYNRKNHCELAIIEKCDTFLFDFTDY